MHSVKLSPLETKIIQHIAMGMTNREIAERLFLSEGTVKNYVTRLFNKVNVKNRASLAIFYYENINPGIRINNDHIN